MLMSCEQAKKNVVDYRKAQYEEKLAKAKEIVDAQGPEVDTLSNGGNTSHTFRCEKQFTKIVVELCENRKYAVKVTPWSEREDNITISWE